MCVHVGNEPERVVRGDRSQPRVTRTRRAIHCARGVNRVNRVASSGVNRAASSSSSVNLCNTRKVQRPVGSVTFTVHFVLPERHV